LGYDQRSKWKKRNLKDHPRYADTGCGGMTLAISKLISFLEFDTVGRDFQ